VAAKARQLNALLTLEGMLGELPKVSGVEDVCELHRQRALCQLQAGVFAADVCCGKPSHPQN
jgi:hypothetical protein